MVHVTLLFTNNPSKTDLVCYFRLFDAFLKIRERPVIRQVDGFMLEFFSLSSSSTFFKSTRLLPSVR